MSRGRDLTDAERAFVHNKIMQSWDSERRQAKEGGRKRVLKACVNGGVRVSDATVSRVATEAKRQEEESEKSVSWTLGRSKAWITARLEKENVVG